MARKKGVTYGAIAEKMGISPQLFVYKLRQGLTIEEREQCEQAAIVLFNDMMQVVGLRIRVRTNKLKEAQDENL